MTFLLHLVEGRPGPSNTKTAVTKMEMRRQRQKKRMQIAGFSPACIPGPCRCPVHKVWAWFIQILTSDETSALKAEKRAPYLLSTPIYTTPSPCRSLSKPSLIASCVRVHSWLTGFRSCQYCQCGPAMETASFTSHPPEKPMMVWVRDVREVPRHAESVYRASMG